MDQEEFVDNLHFHVDRVSPANREVAWEDAPLPYKVYRKLPVTPLSADLPLTLKYTLRQDAFSATLREIGHLLWYSFGLNSVTQNIVKTATDTSFAVTTQSLHRFVPSGGALYPSELYVYLKPTDAQSGVYHYDTAHHSLTLLRAGNYDLYLSQCLGDRCDVSSCFGMAFVSTVFWRNYFKYYQFAYRLQGLDAGALMGQLLEVGKRFGVHSTVFFQFLDDAVNRLLGLNGDEESTYAAIALSSTRSTEPKVAQASTHTTVASKQSNTHAEEYNTEDLCQTMVTVNPEEYIRSKRIRQDPLMKEMNQRSKLNSSTSFTLIPADFVVDGPREGIPLPRKRKATRDFAQVCLRRYSPGYEFVRLPVDLEQVSSVICEAWQGFLYDNDLTATRDDSHQRLHIYGCLYGVEGTPDGAYRYDPLTCALQLVARGDYRWQLQAGMVMDNVNLLTVPMCWHISGRRDHLMSDLGCRGYRIQQMEAGMLAQRILLAASAQGMNGHPLLGFDGKSVDDLYHLTEVNETALIQIPVGPCRTRPQLAGPLRG